MALVVLLLLVASPYGPLAETAGPAAASDAATEDAPALPLDPDGLPVLPTPDTMVRFEPNLGGAEAPFVARTPQDTVLLGPDSLTYHPHDGSPALRIGFPGAAPSAITGEGGGALGHYFLGNEPDQWQTGVPQYDHVRYTEMHPGVDLVVRADGDRVRFDHIVAPGSDLDQVRLAFPGADEVALEDDGRLAIRSGAEVRHLDAPIVHQDTSQGRAEVEGAFRIHDDGTVGYRLGAYDASLPLTIDPVLRYASYLGNGDNDAGEAMALGAPSGNTTIRHIHVAGHATLANGYPSGFPASGQHMLEGAMPADQTVAYVAKFSYDVVTRQVTPLWYTFVGGSSAAPGQPLGWPGDDRAFAVAVDPQGNVAITGETMSRYFPVVEPIVDITDNRGVYEGTTRGNEGLNHHDAFVVELNPDGDALRFSSYLGSDSHDAGKAIAYAPGGDIVVAGETQWNLVAPAPNFPVKNAAQLIHGDATTISTGYDAFMARINTSLPVATFVFSTFLGGDGDDHAEAVAADADGVYVAGWTKTRANFPVSSGAYQTSGSDDEGFVARYDLSGTQEYAALLGGGSRDNLYGVAPAGGGAAWVVGRTWSNNYPVCPADCASGSPAAIQSNQQGSSYDAVISRLDATGSDLTFSSYLGGTRDDVAHAVAVDPASGGIVLSGSTKSLNFLLEEEVVANRGGSEAAFVARIDPDQSSPLRFSSYLGGSGTQVARGVAGDEYGVIYVAGTTTSGLTTLNPVQGTHGGADDAFVTVLGKRHPDAWIRAASGTIEEKSDVEDQTPVSTLPVLVVPAGTEVTLDASLSEMRDFPLDLAQSEWTLYEGDGATVLDNDVGTTPSFSPLRLNVVDDQVACVRVHDELPRWHPDGNDTACIRIDWENRPPIAADDIVTVQEDSVDNDLLVLDNDADPDGHDIRITGITGIPSSQGTLTFDDTVIRFTPAADLYTLPSHTGAPSAITFEYTIKDELNAEDTASVTIDVQNVNDPPVAEDDAYTVVPGSVTSLDVLDNDDDPVDPPNALTITQVDDPGDGSAVLQNGQVVYTAPALFVGTVVLGYTIEDAHGANDTASITIQVAPKDGVLAFDDAYTLNEDEATDLNVLDNDLGPEKSPPAVLNSVSHAAHGTTVIEGGAIRYTPDADFFGSDTFTYTLERGGTTSTAIVNITVLPLNDPPTARDDEFLVQEDSTGNILSVLANDTSEPDDAEEVLVVDVGDAENGTTTLTDGILRYTPNADFFGKDTFTYTIADPEGAEATATLTVLVDAVPDAPVAGDDAFTITAGLSQQELDVLQNDLDADGDALGIVEVEWNSTYDELMNEGGLLKVSPGKTFIGEVVFRYRITDGALESEWSEVTLDIVAPDEPLLVLRVLTAPLCAAQPIEVRAIALQSDRLATTWDWSAGHGAEVIHHTGDSLDWTFTADAGSVALDLAVLLQGEEGSDWASETWMLDVINCVAPTADFGFTTNGRSTRFEDRSSDSDGSVEAWHWDFGDGTSSADSSPVHTYAKGGHYLVRLTVTDDDGNTHAVERVVQVLHGSDSGSGGGGGPSSGSDTSDGSPGDGSGAEQQDRPPIAVASAPEWIVVGEPVVLDGSSSLDPDGDILSYRWSQTGGSNMVLSDPTSAKATFTAQEVGVLRFRLQVEAGGAEDETEAVVHVVGLAPQADFDIQVGETVQLRDTSQNAEGATRTWFVGDQQHEGDELLLDLPPGEHQVRLVVESASGRSEAVQNVHVPQPADPSSLPDATSAPPLSVDQRPAQAAQVSIWGWGIVGVLALAVLAAAAWLLTRRPS